MHPKYVRPLGSVDKSVLTFGEPKRIRDRSWLDFLGTQACWNCGAEDGTVVGAHIRWGNEGGGSLKPPDDLAVPLCHKCHMIDQEPNPGPEFWAACLKNIARRAYARWKQSKSR